MKETLTIRSRCEALLKQILPRESSLALLRSVADQAVALFALAPAPVPVRVRARDRRD